MQLIKRLIIALIFIPLLLLIFWFGGIGFLSFLGLVVVLQLFELREMFLKKGFDIPILIIPLGMFIYIAIALEQYQYAIILVFIIFLYVISIDILRNRLNEAYSRLSAAMGALIYSPLFMAMVYRIRLLPDGRYLLLSLLGIIWITDSCAYFVGIYWGKHRGIFKASPKKSLEGFVAGIISAFLGAFVAMLLFDFSWWQCFALGFSVGLMGQWGDLIESVIKRDFDVKDSSNLLPGHGGLLDRFDSLMIAAPSFYAFAILFGWS